MHTAHSFSEISREKERDWKYSGSQKSEPPIWFYNSYSLPDWSPCKLENGRKIVPVLALKLSLWQETIWVENIQRQCCIKIRTREDQRGYGAQGSDFWDLLYELDPDFSKRAPLLGEVQLNTELFKPNEICMPTLRMIVLNSKLKDWTIHHTTMFFTRMWASSVTRPSSFQHCRAHLLHIWRCFDTTFVDVQHVCIPFALDHCRACWLSYSTTRTTALNYLFTSMQYSRSWVLISWTSDHFPTWAMLSFN